MSIEIHSIVKIYGKESRKKGGVRALAGVSLSVSSGEIFALIGPNGAGKSTLVKILLGIVHPTSGTATILDRPVSDHSARESVGYLPENMHYPPLLTPHAFLHAVGSLHGVRHPELSQRIAFLLELLDMKKWERTAFKKFSKGMMQRIGLAQALVHDPQVLFLDEPSDGLDPIGRKDFRDLLKRLRDEGKTIFMNSHLLSEVELVADRIAVIRSGSILKTGSLNEIVPPIGGFTVTIRGELPEEMYDALSIYPVTTANGLAIIEVPTAADLERLQSMFKTQNIAVESIVARRLTLEESFLSLIKESPR
ncbi:MAG: ABC transporter ATP-binding protein [Ignavibacteria bacterium]|nr:ABC transporter ATP-binding protein [Ignavibacteria bacterium]